MKLTTLVLVLGLALAGLCTTYGWLAKDDPANSLAQRIPPPNGYKRVPVERDSFAEWLRDLPLKPGHPPVYLYNGQKKGNQSAHAAVFNIDTGKRDLQQCVDAVIRLRAEYLYHRKRYADIHFNFTSGDRASFTKWAEGYRATVRGNRVSWRKTAKPDSSYPSFRKYLDLVFTYAGTASFSKEMHRVPVKDMQIGDVFIRGGSPGHAVIVVDMAVDSRGKKYFLLAQSYMPAQDIHLLVNPNNARLSPWYALDFGDTLVTPEWTFTAKELSRF
ncbi:MAG: DUF4846 domain-containing protein [Armatimonadota bacterium]